MDSHERAAVTSRLAKIASALGELPKYIEGMNKLALTLVPIPSSRTHKEQEREKLKAEQCRLANQLWQDGE